MSCCTFSSDGAITMALGLCEVLQRATKAGQTLSEIMQYGQIGWPSVNDTPPELQSFSAIRNHKCGSLINCCRAVIPLVHRKQILEQVTRVL